MMKKIVVILTMLFAVSCGRDVLDFTPTDAFLCVVPIGVTTSDENLLTQYVFVYEENLFVDAQGNGGNAIYSAKANVSNLNCQDGEYIIQSAYIPAPPRTSENMTLVFQWPHQGETTPLLTEWNHSPMAEEMGLPTTKEDNELVCEIIKYNKRGLEYKIVGNDYYYAGIKNIAISADKPLFGFGAGVDISQKFRMVSAPTLLLATFPTFAVTCRIEDKKPTSLVEFNNSLLSAGGYAVKFTEQPTEKYDEITFTVAMDILLPDGGERTLTGSVKVAFE